MLHKRSAALETQFKCNFSKATSTRPKTYYPAIKEMFLILALSFLSDNVTVFTYFNQRTWTLSNKYLYIEIMNGGYPWFVAEACSFAAAFITIYNAEGWESTI